MRNVCLPHRFSLSLPYSSGIFPFTPARRFFYLKKYHNNDRTIAEEQHRHIGAIHFLNVTPVSHYIGLQSYERMG
jgi:hypothetical protein